MKINFSAKRKGARTWYATNPSDRRTLVGENWFCEFVYWSGNAPPFERNVRFSDRLYGFRVLTGVT